MDFSMHSRHFDLAQIPMDQDDSKADLLSQPETSNLAISAPTFSHSDWARWRSQPALLTPRQYDGYSFPRVADAEPYNLGPLSQGLMGDSNEYLDSYRSHVPHQMPGTSMEALASQAVVGPSDWGVLDTHGFKDHSYGYPTHLDSLQPLQNSPPSPLSEVSSYHSPQSLAAASPAMTAHTTDRLSPRSITGEHKEERPGHPPYSHLIYQALKNAPGNKLPLQGIYAWFEANTDKGRDPNAKGWQNSIRHNLSMNAGFEAVKEEVEPGRKSINFWRLTPEAIQSGGIQSTTRYRKLQNQRKAMNSGSRALQRQPSGSKGSHPNKVVKSRGNNSPHGERSEAYHQQQMTGVDPVAGHPYGPTSLPGMQQYLQRPMGAIVGCTTMLPDSDTVFLDSAEHGPSFAMGNGHGWFGTESGPNRVHDPAELPGRSSWEMKN